MGRELQIQSISIGSYSTRTDSSSSKPFVVYTITASSPTQSWAISHRYSDFAALVAALTEEIGSEPPGKLPAKTSGLLGALGMKRLLSPDEIQLRRVGLERWLKALISSSDTRWANSKAMRDFLALSAGGQPAEGKGGAEAAELAGPTAEDLTESTWLVEREALVSLAQELSATLRARDASAASLDPTESAAAHAQTAQAKKGLVALVTRLTTLDKALLRHAKEGLLQGELNRREGMARSLRAEVEKLGLWTVKVPSKGRSGRGASPGAAGGDGADRSALLGGAGAARGRVLGAGAPLPQETAETRPLDNSGLLQLQQTYMQTQDNQLDSLAAILRRQKDLGLLIGKELEEQGELLDALGGEVDSVQDRMKKADKQMRRLG